ncbi:MAG: dephospho-CoA kinase [Planctomycetes bacterium]|nr:dephospho-CoA kinase [Planctomycetota bacterium]
MSHILLCFTCFESFRLTARNRAVRLSSVGKIAEKPVIGILGGIGSGKSTIAAEFAKLGCKVIDADKIAHELLEEPPVRKKVVSLFGQAVLDSSGKIDRRKIAEVVFADDRMLASLNRIIHPLVLKRTQELIEQYRRQNQVKAIVLDMPLLVEVGWHKRCDKLIFVDCEQKIRQERAEKMGFDKKQIKIRENFQISLDNKASLADNTIENNSDFSAIAKQVTGIFSYIVDNG